MADTEKKHGQKPTEKKTTKIRVDKSDNTLMDKAAKNFWKKHFEGKDIVTNQEFGAALRIYLKKIYADEAAREDFIQIVLTKFLLLVDPSKYPDKTPPEEFVDTHCLQAAIHVFGPWKQMFEMIKKHFYADEVEQHKEPRPLKVWHGRMTEEKANELLLKKNGNDSEGRKSSRKQRYLLRYGVGSIICSNIRRGKQKTILIKHEPVIRKKPSKVFLIDCAGKRTGKTKPVDAKWTYIESIASAGRFNDNYSHYTLLVNFLEMMRGEYCDDLKYRAKKIRKIRTPVYAPGMAPDNKSPEAESSDVDSPPIRKPIVTIDDDEDETDEETLKELKAEESKES